MIKLTEKRQLVLNKIKNSKKAINALTIYENIGKEKIDLSTVYRAIDFLVENNLLLSFHFNNNTYYIFNDKNKHYHYFICIKCLNMTKINCNMKSIIDSLENNYNYDVINHEMNIYGHCNKCLN